jgi:hypothetical protein
MTLAIGASLAEVKGINLLPEQLRDLKKKFIQKIIIGVAGIGLVLASILIYISLLIQLNVIKQDSVKLDSEYTTLMPNIDDVKKKLLIQHYANHRLDMGGVLREFSYLPDKVYLTNLTLKDGEFTLTGQVSARLRDAKKILKSLMVELKTISLQNVRISAIEENPDDQTSKFTITANVVSGSGT